MTNDSRAAPAVIRVLLADSKPMESQLFAGSLRHQGFQVLTCESEVSSILEVVEHGVVDIAVISCAAAHSELPDMTALHTLHLTHPQIPKVCLMETEGGELAVQAFRSGARRNFRHRQATELSSRVGLPSAIVAGGERQW